MSQTIKIMASMLQRSAMVNSKYQQPIYTVSMLSQTKTCDKLTVNNQQ